MRKVAKDGPHQNARPSHNGLSTANPRIANDSVLEGHGVCPNCWPALARRPLCSCADLRTPSWRTRTTINSGSPADKRRSASHAKNQFRVQVPGRYPNSAASTGRPRRSVDRGLDYLAPVGAACARVTFKLVAANWAWHWSCEIGASCASVALARLAALIASSMSTSALPVRVSKA